MFLLTFHCTEVHFASLLSGEFTTMAVINPPERKLAKRISVWFVIGWKICKRSEFHCVSSAHQNNSRNFLLFFIPSKRVFVWESKNSKRKCQNDHLSWSKKPKHFRKKTNTKKAIQNLWNKIRETIRWADHWLYDLATVRWNKTKWFQL